MSELVSKPKFIKGFISHVMVAKKEIEIWCQTDPTLGSRVETLLNSCHNVLSNRFAINSFELKPIPEPEVGKYYLTHMKNDLHFYRVVVTHVEPESGRALVSFIDFGNEEWIPFKQLVSWDLFFDVKPLAQKFFLADIKPKDKEWDSDKVKRSLEPFLLSTFQCEVVRISKNTECIRVYDQFFNQPLVQKLLKECGGILAIDMSATDVMKGLDLTLETRLRLKETRLTNALQMNGFSDKQTIESISSRDRYMKSKEMFANKLMINKIEVKDSLQMEMDSQLKNKKPKLEELTQMNSTSIDNLFESIVFSEHLNNQKTKLNENDLKPNETQFEDNCLKLIEKTPKLQNETLVLDQISEEFLVNRTEELKRSQEISVGFEPNGQLLNGDNELKNIETNSGDKDIETANKLTENETKIADKSIVIENESKLIESNVEITSIEAKVAENDSNVTEIKEKMAENDSNVTEIKEKMAENETKVVEIDSKVNEIEEKVLNKNNELEGNSKLNESTEKLGSISDSVSIVNESEQLLSTKNWIYVTAVHSDNSFHCQLSSKFDEISAITEKMTEFYNKVYKTEELDLNLPEVKVNDIIAARYSADELWYRAEVKAMNKDKLEVVYIDFGNDEIVGKSESKQLDGQFRGMAPQAIHCALIGQKIPISELKGYELEMNEIECEFVAIERNVYTIKLIEVKAQ